MGRKLYAKVVERQGLAATNVVAWGLRSCSAHFMSELYEVPEQPYKTARSLFMPFLELLLAAEQFSD